MEISSAYNSFSKVIIHQGKVEEFLPTLPDESMQLIVTSPPYNLGKEYEKKVGINDYLLSQEYVIYEYSHLGGLEILTIHYPQIEQEIKDIISRVVAQRIKLSKEKTKKDRFLYSPVDMNKQLKNYLTQFGYKELRDTYSIEIQNSTIKIHGAYKQADYVKEKVNIEVQFGKYAFMFYEMAKFQYFFNENKSDVGVKIVPCHNLYKEMSSGVSYGEQLVHDIERLKRHFPAVPIKVMLIDVNEAQQGA